MPLFLLAFIILLVYLKKTKSPLFKLSFFLNALLIIYLLVDTAGLFWKSSHPDKNKLAIYGEDKKNIYLPCVNCADPDIYFYYSMNTPARVVCWKLFTSITVPSTVSVQNGFRRSGVQSQQL
jgi:hypothetical protein